MFDEEIQSFFKVLASPHRQTILLSFIETPRQTVSEIVQRLTLRQSTVSEHLALMRETGFLLAHKEGREVYYTPDRQKILAVLDRIAHLLRNCC